MKIGVLYLLSGFGGSLLSILHMGDAKAPNTVSVGASGALFGLLGAMLSELLTNWTIYLNKVLYNDIFCCLERKREKIHGVGVCAKGQCSATRGVGGETPYSTVQR